MIGKTISHYRIFEKLGEGGMGVVYKAEDTKLKRFVALKFLPPELTHTPEAKERFIREAQAAAALDHPHICPVHEVGEAEGQAFIVMSYVEGQSLHKKIESGPLNADEAAVVAIQVAEGLQEAHEKGIIHRDIKSANIMLTEKGQAKIMDFGLAKLIGRTSVTDTATIMGTVDYMSPEQARGEPVDHRTDIWSLGVVLYEMLTGRAPFDAPSNAALVHKIIYDEPPELQSVNPDVPSGLSIVVARAMAKDKEDRYASASEFLKDIRNCELPDAEEADLIKRRGETRPMGAARPAVSKRTKLGIAAAVVAALVCLCVALTVFLRRPEPVEVSVVHEAEEKTCSSIAVLPFEDMSAAKDQEYFCDGISEELINALTQLEDLRVVARTSTFSFKGKGLKISDIGRELNVETILEGSVRRSGDRLRITVQLVDVAGGHHLWSDRYDRELDDVFAIQDEITQAVIAKLKPKLLGEEKVRLAKQRQRLDLEAYNLYLRGCWFYNKRTGESIGKAIELFEQAIKKDANYAAAYARLANCYVVLGLYAPVAAKDVFPKAKEAALKALTIDENLGETHVALANVKMYFEWDWEGAEHAFQRAIEIDPGDADAHHFYSILLMWTARFSEAIEEAEKAIEFDPLSLFINRDMAVVLNYARRYDQAIAQCKRVIEMDQNFPLTHLVLGGSYLGKGMYEDALAEFKKEADISGTSRLIEAWGGGAVHAAMGNREEAQHALGYLLELSKQTYVPPCFVAHLFFCTGNEDRGFDYLNRAYEVHDIWLCYLKIDPRFDSVTSDPRYIDLLKKMNLEK